MMKFIIKMILFSAICKTGLSQNFKGKIAYDIAYLLKDSSIINPKQIEVLFGSAQEFHLTNEYYKLKSNGLISEEVFTFHNNTIKYKTKDSDSLLAFNANYNSDTVLDFKIKKKTKEIILGYKCHKLILNTKQSHITIFFTKKIRVNKTPFLNHKYKFGDLIIDKTGSIPLKTIIENKDLIVIYTATSIQIL